MDQRDACFKRLRGRLLRSMKAALSIHIKGGAGVFQTHLIASRVDPKDQAIWISSLPSEKWSQR
eukprot:6185858-Pleurochrysis_carterae.AAC.4